MNRLGIPQDRIARRLGQAREVIRDHLADLATLPNPPNADLSKGFTGAQVAEKHNWTEPMVWSLALEDKEDLERFKELGWGLRTWDQWEWNDCDKRFGDDWPGRIPAQLIAHILKKNNQACFHQRGLAGLSEQTSGRRIPVVVTITNYDYSVNNLK